MNGRRSLRIGSWFATYRASCQLPAAADDCHDVCRHRRPVEAQGHQIEVNRRSRRQTCLRRQRMRHNVGEPFSNILSSSRIQRRRFAPNFRTHYGAPVANNRFDDEERVLIGIPDQEALVQTHLAIIVSKRVGASACKPIVHRLKNDSGERALRTSERRFIQTVATIGKAIRKAWSSVAVVRAGFGKDGGFGRHPLRKGC